MFKFLRTSETDDLAFCERCGEVCDHRCRADALARRTLDQALRNGWRLA